MRQFLLIMACSLLAGCIGDISVRIDTSHLHTSDLLAQVEVNDRRPAGIAASKREGAFGTPMGNITFNPPEVQLVKRILEHELTKVMRNRGVMTRQDYTCDIIEFGVNTDTTPVYWDVFGRVRLELKHNGNRYNLFGTHTERTYLWPGESIITNVIERSLEETVADLDLTMKNM